MRWATRQLDQLGHVSRGRSRHRPRDAAHLYGGPFPFIQTGDVKHAGLKVHYVHEDYWPLNTTLWVKEFRRVSPLFAFFLLSSLRLDQYNGGVSVPTLDRKVVHKIEIVVPNSKMQALFSDYVLPMFTQLRTLDIYNQKLRAARDLLLPKLMSGEIRV